ncbi:MAG: HU family DNA-binding protein [candidate division KSB1 bacterium]|nr:HU family DNA-binding protein [candidate division KSB1 bacterium]
MTKADIVERIAEGVGLTKLETQAVIDGFLAIVKYALQKHQRVDLRGFGNFVVIQRKARVARNPGTNEEVRVPPRYAVVFKPSQELKKLINKEDDTIG